MFNEGFWVLLAFVALIALVRKPVSSAVVRVLDERSDKIRRELEEAEQLREEAQALLAQYERQHRDALKEAEHIIKVAKETADKMKQQAEEERNKMFERHKAQTLEKIAQIEADAIQELTAVYSDLTLESVRKLMDSELSKTSHNKLIQDSIKGFSESTIRVS